MNKLMLAIALAAVSAAAAQTAKIAAKSSPAKKAAVPHTPWGDPDLQGVWNDATSTPLQRPNGVGSKDVLSDEEAAEFQDKLAGDLSLERKDGTAEADVNRGFNEHWDDARADSCHTRSSCPRSTGNNQTKWAGACRHPPTVAEVSLRTAIRAGLTCLPF